MCNDTFHVAERYYEIGNYQKAYEQIVNMELDIESVKFIKHYNLLALILFKLERTNDAIEIYNDLLSKFPDNSTCISHWIHFFSNKEDYVLEAYELAKNSREKYPNDPWLPFIMAYMAYDYRIEPIKGIVKLIDEALALSRKLQTLRLASRVFYKYGRKEEAKICLEQVVESAPDEIYTYDVLLEYLSNERCYIELGQVSSEAIKKYPQKEEFKSYLKCANRQLSVSSFDKLLNAVDYITNWSFIERSSVVRWKRWLIDVMQYLSLGFSIFLVLFIVLIYLISSVLFFHYVFICNDERGMRALKKIS